MRSVKKRFDEVGVEEEKGVEGNNTLVKISLCCSTHYRAQCESLHRDLLFRVKSVLASLNHARSERPFIPVPINIVKVNNAQMLNGQTAELR